MLSVDFVVCSSDTDKLTSAHTTTRTNQFRAMQKFCNFILKSHWMQKWRNREMKFLLKRENWWKKNYWILCQFISYSRATHGKWLLINNRCKCMHILCSMFFCTSIFHNWRWRVQVDQIFLSFCLLKLIIFIWNGLKFKLIWKFGCRQTKDSIRRIQYKWNSKQYRRQALTTATQRKSSDANSLFIVLIKFNSAVYTMDLGAADFNVSE